MFVFLNINTQDYLIGYIVTKNVKLSVSNVAKTETCTHSQIIGLARGWKMPFTGVNVHPIKRFRMMM